MDPAAPTRSSLVTVFRVVALAEAVSYLVLLGAAIAKRVGDGDGEGLVPVLGPIHGVVFLAYFVLTLLVADQLRWHWKQTLLVLFAAVIPLGGLFVERRLLRPADSRATV